MSSSSRLPARSTSPLCISFAASVWALRAGKNSRKSHKATVAVDGGVDNKLTVNIWAERLFRSALIAGTNEVSVAVLPSVPPPPLAASHRRLQLRFNGDTGNRLSGRCRREADTGAGFSWGEVPVLKAATRLSADPEVALLYFFYKQKNSRKRKQKNVALFNM